MFGRMTASAQRSGPCQCTEVRIVVRWKNPQPSWFEAEGYCYHAVASNREESESASEVLWRHNQRGEAENWHKELKLELGMEQMPCGQQAAKCGLLWHRGCGLQPEPGAESQLAAARVPAFERRDAALETVSCGGQAGAACAGLGVEGAHGRREAGAARSGTPEVL